jgi:hypothetical protein
MVLLLGLYYCGYVGPACRYTDSVTGVQFSFRDYDRVSRAQKESAALRGLNAAFPTGSNKQELMSFMQKCGGSCTPRTNIPPQDRTRIEGDHIYCVVTFAESPIGILRARWLVDFKYSGDQIDQLRVDFLRYVIGGG